MSEAITATERVSALSLGVAIGNETMTRQQLFQMIDAAKAKMTGPPNRFQLSLADRFGITLDANAIGWDYRRALYQALSVKAFVYSVDRRHCGARWKCYDETGLSDAWVDSVCRAILADSTLRYAADQYEYTDSQTRSDLWCNMGKAWLKNEAVRYVLSQLGVDTSASHAGSGANATPSSSSLSGKPIAPMRLPPSESIEEPPVIYPPRIDDESRRQEYQRYLDSRSPIAHRESVPPIVDHKPAHRLSRRSSGRRSHQNQVAVLCGLGIVCAMLVGAVLVIVTSPNSRQSSAADSSEREPVDVYTPIETVICATDEDFLDSSPLISPARFVRVEPGTELLIVGFGGVFDKLYWKLANGGREHIYVYRDQLDTRFRVVRTIER